jgi:hypothetical protein
MAAVVYVLAGCATGLMVNPYFPHNLQLLWEHMQIKLTASDFDTKVGSEWYPYDSWEFLGNSAVACIAMLVGYIAFEPTERRRSLPDLLSAAFNVVDDHDSAVETNCGILAAVCHPVRGLFTAAVAGGFRPYLTRLPPEDFGRTKPFFDREGVAEAPVQNSWRDVIRLIGVSTVAVILSVFLFFNLRATVKEIGQSEPHDYYRTGAEWMRNNVPAGQLVFNTDWDDFPAPLYFDPRITTSPDSIRAISTTRIRSSRVFTSASRSAQKKIPAL